MKILKFNEGRHIKIDVEESPKLKMDIATVHFITDYDLQEFVKRVYNIDYDYSEHEDSSSYGRYRVSGSLLQSNRDRADKIKTNKIGRLHFSAHLLLNCLCEDGYIEPGSYVIEV